MSGTINSNAERLRVLHQRAKTLFKQHPHGPEHHAACAAFHGQYDVLAFPGGLSQGLHELKNDHSETVELTIQFLEADPRFFRSGYIKEKVLRRLKHCTLTDSQCSRLRRLVLRSLDGGGRREFRGYSRLAGRLMNDDILRSVSERQASRNPEVVRRVEDVLQVWRSLQLID